MEDDDRSTDDHEPTIAIVGGGVHGVHLAIRLLEAELVDLDELCLIEPEGLLGGFRRKCHQCGMTELRSPLVHHVSPDPFSLRDFARSRGRADELVPSEVGADRPTVSLFFDHADWVCRQYDLESAVVDALATDIRPRGDGVDVATTAGEIAAAWCLLTVGHGRSYTYPAWTDDLPSSAPVTHVWDSEFDPDDIGPNASVGIVGSGITAGQLAPTLVQPGRSVTIFARSPFRVESLEADTDWMHFSSVCDELHSLPSASRDREQLVSEARYDGTMPPHVFRRLRRAIDRESIAIEQTEITVATEAGGTVVVTCRDGTARCLDRLVCTTGFDSPYEGALFRRLRSRPELRTGYRGSPVLDDETLRWRRQDGTRSRIAVSGSAARQVLGPFAQNIIGARRAGDLVVGALEAEREAGARDAAVS